MSSISALEMQARLRRMEELFDNWNVTKTQVVNKLAGKFENVSLNPLEEIQEEVSFTQHKFSDLSHVFSEVSGNYLELFHKIKQGCFDSKKGFFGMSVADSISWAAGIITGITSAAATDDIKHYADPTTLKIASLALFLLSQAFSKYNDVSSRTNINQLENVQSGLFKVTQIFDQRKVLDKVGEISAKGQALLERSGREQGNIDHLLAEWRGMKKDLREGIKEYIKDVDPVVFFNEEQFADQFEQWRLNSLGVLAILTRGVAAAASSDEVTVNIDIDEMISPHATESTL